MKPTRILALVATQLMVVAGVARPQDPGVLGPCWQVDGGQAGARFGHSVATAGDVNGDGFCDVLVGAPRYDDEEQNEGLGLLYSGSAAGLQVAPSWSVQCNQHDAWLGFCVASAGDVNGDGFDDVIIGAHRASNGETEEGQAFVFLGSPAGPSATPAWTAESDQDHAEFG